MPLPALLAVLMVFGIKSLGHRLIRRFQPYPPQPLDTAAGFILAAALLAAVVHLLALTGVAYPWLLRIMAWGLAAGGIMELSRINKARLLRLYDQAAAGFREQSLWGKAACVLLAVTLTSLLLGALGPPTDADSLNYHLGVPMVHSPASPGLPKAGLALCPVGWPGRIPQSPGAGRRHRHPGSRPAIRWSGGRAGGGERLRPG